VPLLGPLADCGRLASVVQLAAMTEMHPKFEALSALEYYNVIRQRIEHEDNLILQRLSWLVASQSFLFTAYAIVLNGLAVPPPPPTVAEFIAQQQLLFRLIPVVGALTCALIYVSILAAVRAMRLLRRAYRSRFGQEDASVPPIQVSAPTRNFGLAAPLVLPLVFVAVWLLLWMRGLGGS
jgi:hypothetical protein